ncbi:MAG: hypothetical protein ACRDQ5_12605, partial [Sciscionella sp.]
MSFLKSCDFQYSTSASKYLSLLPFGRPLIQYCRLASTRPFGPLSVGSSHRVACGDQGASGASGVDAEQVCRLLPWVGVVQAVHDGVEAVELAGEL